MKQFILIGHPVGHSVSPPIHHAAYQQLGIEAQYRAVDCPDRSAVQAQVAALRDGTICGANVTVPWKQVAFELADHIDSTAAQVGAANVLARDEGGQIVAYNTDASALSSELSTCLALVPSTSSKCSGALVLGSGGAARAAVVACRLAGIAPVRVSARRFSPNQSPETWESAESFRSLGAEPIAWPSAQNTELSNCLSSTKLIVQATSAGMKGTSGGTALVETIPWERFTDGAIYDLVYNPVVTPFLAQGQKLGLPSMGGLGMLVGQARDAIEIWLGRRPEPAPMMKAAQEALGL